MERFYVECCKERGYEKYKRLRAMKKRKKQSLAYISKHLLISCFELRIALHYYNKKQKKSVKQRLPVACEALFRKSLPAPDLAYGKLESQKKRKKENILKAKD